ncbi:MFS transporter [Arthrobacter crystallopoietes]|uniref:MFS transporter, CP family, cyanate transporter n=1 Tax=Crystallibacter crystallopoietes TaxID=37928 RepID=A0A1H1C1X4_9MICC|nr:MFS transporter [Arthrobacter crystallopoietes]AUI50911.1 MFS transporter [Arthrobacter crystallopoietes]SDQ58237.1 MFS transporter, CP family, cyanate transporter [Arthrobacter crystallopoietes]
MSVVDGVKTERTVRFGLAFVGIMVIAVNLRVAFVSVGPLLVEISSDQGWSNSTAGLLTGLPLIAFAVFSPVAPGLAFRLGLDRALWVSLLLLMLGVLARSAPVEGAIWVGTALLGAAIAFLNVLLPSLVKRDVPTRVSQVTGIYTAAQGAVSAGGAALVVPIAHATNSGWRLALGIWAGLALVALAVLLPRIRRHVSSAGPAADGPSPTYRSPWKSALGWQVTVFMGLQSMAFFILMAWLPSIEQDHGISQVASGMHISVFLSTGTLASLGAGALLHRFTDQRPLALITSVFAVGAYVGLAVAPEVSLLWCVVAALGCGSLIVIALSLFSLRTVHHTQAAALSGMAQSIGYAIAAAGPVAFGALHDLSGGWTLPLAATAGSMLVLCIVAVLSARNRLIG